MADYQILKESIAAVIKENGNQEITGNLLQATLYAMVNALGSGYQFAGVADQEVIPGTPDAKLFYIAAGAGIYPDFNNLVVNQDELAIFFIPEGYSSWYKLSVQVAADKADKDLNAVPDNLAKFNSDGNPIDSGISATSVEETIDDFNGRDGETTDLLSNLQIASGYYYPADSVTPSSNSGSKYSTQDVDISQYDEVRIVAPTYSVAGNDTRACLIIDAERNILASKTWLGEETTTNKTIAFDLTQIPNAKYLLVSYSNAGCPDGITVTGIVNAVPSIPDKIDELSTEVQTIADSLLGKEASDTDLLAALGLTNGYCYYSDSITPVPNSASTYSTEDVDISQYDEVRIIAPTYSTAGSDNRACLVLDAQKNILSALTWGGNATLINKELSFDIRQIPGAKYLLVSYRRANCPDGITVNGRIFARLALPERVGLLEMNVVQNNFAHISFDDMDAPFAWLAANYASISSIFQESFFALLLRLHNDTGAVFTLNCFLSGLTSLANAGNKFATEFRNNANWLKFSFHAYGSGVVYDPDDTTHTYRDAEADYQTFVNNIIAITGGVVNIHQVARLGYYKGALADVLKIRNQSMGAYGFLCADDNRASYYLSSEICTLIKSQGHWFDAQNQLYFVSTNVARLDVSEDITEQSAITFVKDKLNASAGNFAEIFMHQTTLFSDASNDILYTSRGNLILEALVAQLSARNLNFDFTQRHLLNW